MSDLLSRCDFGAPAQIGTAGPAGSGQLGIRGWGDCVAPAHVGGCLQQAGGLAGASPMNPKGASDGSVV